jgi:hypothetical protein
MRGSFAVVAAMKNQDHRRSRLDDPAACIA